MEMPESGPDVVKPEWARPCLDRRGEGGRGGERGAGRGSGGYVGGGWGSGG